jgi:hypothetical protein
VGQANPFLVLWRDSADGNTFRRKNRYLRKKPAAWKNSLCGRDLTDVGVTRSSVSRDGILRETLSIFFRHSGDHALLITL